jgi:hypothetical protein
MELRTRKAWAAVLLTAISLALAPTRALADTTDPSEIHARMESFTTAVGRPLDEGTMNAWVASLAESVGRPIDRARVNEYLVSLSRSAGQPIETGMDQYLASLAESVGRPIDQARVNAYLASFAGAGSTTESADGPATTRESDGMDLTGLGIVALVLVLAIGVAVIHRRFRHDPIASA